MNVEPKSSPGDVFTAVLKQLAAYAAAAAARTGSWYRPGENISLLEPDSIHESFDRQQHELEFEKTVTGTESVGTVTDLAMSQLQGDLLHVAERAFRSRHQTSVRSRLHPLARLAGHGAENGVIEDGLLGYITTLDRLNKSEQKQ